MRELDQIRARVSTFLGEKWSKRVEISAIVKIFGGASRETYRLQQEVEGKSIVV